MKRVEIQIFKEKSDQTFEVHQKNEVKKKHGKKKRRKRPNMDFLFKSPPLYNSNVYPERNQILENQVQRKPEEVSKKVDFKFEYQAGKYDDYLQNYQNIEVTQPVKINPGANIINYELFHVNYDAQLLRE
jgi:hypothetical protein